MTKTRRARRALQSMQTAVAVATGVDLPEPMAADLLGRGWTPEDLDTLSLLAGNALLSGTGFACDQNPSPDLSVQAQQVRLICMTAFPLLESLDRILGPILARNWISMLLAAPEEHLEPVATETERTGNPTAYFQYLTALLGDLAPYAWAAGIPIEHALDLTDTPDARADLLNRALARGFQFIVRD